MKISRKFVNGALAVILIPLIIIISIKVYNSYQINQTINKMKLDIPVATQVFEISKPDLEILRNGQFTANRMKYAYDGHADRMGVFIEDDYETDGSEKSYAVTVEELQPILPKEEIEALLFLTTSLNLIYNYNYISSRDTNIPNHISARLNINGITFYIDNGKVPLESSGYYYIEALDGEYYIQVAHRRSW